MPGVPGERLAGTCRDADAAARAVCGRRPSDRAERDWCETALVRRRSGPHDVTVEGFAISEETPLKGIALGRCALMALMIDILATLWLVGPADQRPRRARCCWRC